MLNQPILKGVLFASLLFIWIVSGVSQETTNALFPPTGHSADHWGEVVDGFQLSIHSSTNVFIRGQPILITTISRNTTTNLMGWSLPSGLEIVEAESGKTIHTFTNPVADNTPSSTALDPLAPKKQIEEIQDLQRKLAGAKAGTYHLHAKQDIHFASFPLAVPGVGLLSPLPALPGISARQGNNATSFISTNIQSGTLDIQLIDPK
jgi:hypothetical protein